ncbi:MAG TPA: rhamnogalacturonan acetylesterase [Gemmatimonadaceae bacterium]|nr:rhamnogalacturonan acetylesterase [Gemmatimonadaceae bacterium]
MKLLHSAVGAVLALLLGATGCAKSRASESASRVAPTATTSLNAALPSIFIAGNSTAARGAGARQQGWGVPFAGYFDTTKVNVVNRARGGRSSRTFITEGLWDTLLADVKRGDIVLIEFGHNDAGAINDSSRARGSLPGLGDDSIAIDNLLTKKHEIVHSFGWYMRKMIAETKAKGATPIVLSLSVRNVWQNGQIERGSGRYSGWSRDIAREAGVQFIDLTNLVADQFQAMGEGKVKALYEQDHTHFNWEGADIHARTVVSGLKALRPSPVRELLSAKGAAVKPDPLVGLGLSYPRDRALPTLFLVGNSTVRNGRGDGAGGQWGWGDHITPFFDTTKINVVNRAVGGLSARTFISQGYWDRVLALVKPGDFVMVEFGHNDASPVNDSSRARGVLPGIGPDSTIIDNILTKQKGEVVYSFGGYLRMFARDARSRGATPIINSLTPRKFWESGRIRRTRGSFADWAEQAARAERVPFVNVTELASQKMDTMPPARVDSLYGDANLHSSGRGAELFARTVVEGLRALGEADPLREYLRP